MFLVFHFLQFFSFLIAFKLKNSNVFIFSKPVCFVIHLKLIHRFNFNLKIISVTLQQTVFFQDRSTSRPTQPYPWPWGLWRWHSLTGCETAGRWERFGAAGSSPSLPRPWRNNLQVPSWCAAAISLALLTVRAVGQTHPCCVPIPFSEERTWRYMFLPSPGNRCYKCLHFAMNSELSSKIIHGISHLALMSAWHMFTMGTWR